MIIIVLCHCVLAVFVSVDQDPDCVHFNQVLSKYCFYTIGKCAAGDIGYYDNSEYIFIVDRAKELIKYKGMQVSIVQNQKQALEYFEHEAIYNHQVGTNQVSLLCELMLMYKLQLHKCLAVQIMKPDMIIETKKF